MFIFEMEIVTRFITIIYDMIILLLCTCVIYELIRLLASTLNNYYLYDLSEVIETIIINYTR